MAQVVTENAIASIVKKAVQEHGATREAVIPILSEVNRAFGFIPREAFPEIRRLIHDPENGLFLADSHLYSVSSFYQLLSLTKLGRHVVRFCESAPCHVMGGRKVFQTLEEELGISPGETSGDDKWSLVMTSCLGICGVGPVFIVDEDVYGNVTPEQVHGILEHYD
jgi:NADH-quinone oxidoreductase subunit E